MSTPFDEWDLQDALAVVQMNKSDLEKVASYRKFVDGDHWQDWSGWTGPKPSDNEPDSQTIKEEIVRGFVSRNVVGECVGRHVNGVLGRDVKWSVVPKRPVQEGEQPTTEENMLIEEAKAILTMWIDERKLNEEYDKLARELLVAGVAYQRLFIPPGRLSEDGTIQETDLMNVARDIYLDFPVFGSTVIYTDTRTQRQCTVYIYNEQSSDRPSKQSSDSGKQRAELSYLDGDLTIIRIVGDDSTDKDQFPFGYPLNNRLFVYKVERAALMNAQVTSQQKMLNKTYSMLGRNMDMAGFRERVTINAQMDGAYTEVDGVRTFVPYPMTVGAGVRTDVTGYLLTDENGNETLTTPSYDWADPVDVASFTNTIAEVYTAILGEMNQLHYAMSADATASSVSRITAMAAYLIDLLQTKQQIDGAFAWVLQNVLALSAAVTNRPGYFDSITVSAEASVDPGPISADMITTVIKLWEVGKLTLRTGLTWIGVEDVDAEIAGLEREQQEAAATEAAQRDQLTRMLDQLRSAGA